MFRALLVACTAWSIGVARGFAAEPESWNGRSVPGADCVGFETAEAAKACACTAWNPHLKPYVCAGRWRASGTLHVRDDVNGHQICTFRGAEANCSGQIGDPCACHAISVWATPNCPKGHRAGLVPGKADKLNDKAWTCLPDGETAPKKPGRGS